MTSGRRGACVGSAIAALVAAVIGLCGPSVAAAQSGGRGNVDGSIYTCVDAQGNRLTSDRPIPECGNREQRQLNRDGSVRSVIPPAMTADERADWEARQAKLAQERKSQQDWARRDRNLLARYPNEAAHNASRDAALDVARTAILVSERRLRDLAEERKPLQQETEFYANKPLPAMLKQQLESNDAAADAQRVLIQNQQSEMARINANFDLELTRLRRLWAGSLPGSLGPLETIPPPQSAASAPVHKAPIASPPKP